MCVCVSVCVLNVIVSTAPYTYICFLKIGSVEIRTHAQTIEQLRNQQQTTQVELDHIKGDMLSMEQRMQLAATQSASIIASLEEQWYIYIYIYIHLYSLIYFSVSFILHSLLYFLLIPLRLGTN